MNTFVRDAARLVLIAVVYVAAGKLGLDLAFEHPSSSPVWPPTGIAIAACLVWGLRMLPAVFVGAFVVNQTTVNAPWCSLGIATGNTLEAWLAAVCIERFCNGRRVFDLPQHVFGFAWFAGALAPAVSATIGVSALALARLVEPAQVQSVWITWWLGNGSGALLVAPLILLWREPPAWQGSRVLEGVALALCLFLVPGTVFLGLLPGELVYVGLPLLAWSSFRLGRRMTSTASAALAAIAIMATLEGRGPFVGESINQSLLGLQSFMAVAALTSLAMSAAVSHQRRLTDDVQRRAGTLEDQVVSRGAQIAELNTRLGDERARIDAERERRLVERIAREEAERANRQKDEFLAVLSHELRTPLHTIAGWTALLQSHDLDPEQRRRAGEAIGRSVGTQTRLISDILDISRITAGKLELAPQPLDATALVRGVLETHQPAARAAGLTLVAALPSDSLPIEADPTRVEQVLGNLLGNAIKFTPAGGRLEVALAETVAGIEITVTDDGPGIPAELLPHVFDRFRQGDSSATRRHGGLGLGLTIARHLVELHGGAIRADGAEGRGARFTVELPRRPTIPGTRHDPVPADPERASRGALSGVNVLVVDDDVDGRDLAIVWLAGLGATVQAAASVVEALDRLGRTDFDVVVTDLAMPDHDGYDLLRRLASAGLAKVPPVIALTAQASAQEAERARAAGFAAFLSKPVRLEPLVRCVAECARRDAPNVLS